MKILTSFDPKNSKTSYFFMNLKYNLIISGMDSVFAKMSSATHSLMETDDIETSTQLVKLIKECADCVHSLKESSLVHQ